MRINVKLDISNLRRIQEILMYLRDNLDIVPMGTTYKDLVGRISKQIIEEDILRMEQHFLKVKVNTQRTTFALDSTTIITLATARNNINFIQSLEKHLDLSIFFLYNAAMEELFSNANSVMNKYLMLK